MLTWKRQHCGSRLESECGRYLISRHRGKRHAYSVHKAPFFTPGSVLLYGGNLRDSKAAAELHMASSPAEVAGMVAAITRTLAILEAIRMRDINANAEVVRAVMVLRGAIGGQK